MHKQVLPAIALFSLFAIGTASADGVDYHKKRMAELRGSHDKHPLTEKVLPSRDPSRLIQQNGSDGIDYHKKRMEELRKARG